MDRFCKQSCATTRTCSLTTASSRLRTCAMLAYVGMFTRGIPSLQLAFGCERVASNLLRMRSSQGLQALHLQPWTLPVDVRGLPQA